MLNLSSRNVPQDVGIPFAKPEGTAGNQPASTALLLPKASAYGAARQMPVLWVTAGMTREG
jgi:hypothetical protein